MGDLPLSAITREKALEYRDWWIERLQPQRDGGEPVAPNTVNRHIGNMRSLLERHYKPIGDADFEDPFREF